MKTHGPCSKFQIERDPSKIDWSGLAQSVTERLLFLKHTWCSMPEPILRDLYVPAIQHLARFCAAIEIKVEKP